MIEVKIKAKIVRKKSRSSQFLFSTGHGAFPSPFFKRGSLLAAGLSARARRTAPTCDDDGSARRGSASASSRRVKSSGEKSRRAECPAVRPAAVPAGLHYWWCSGRPAAGHSASTVPPAFALLAPLFRSIIQTLGQAGNLARPAPELAEAIDTIADHWCRFEQWNMLPSCFS